MIQLNADWRIVADTNNWTLEQRKVRGNRAKLAGEEYWDAEGYLGTLGQAISFLIEREVRVSENIMSISDKVEQLKNEMQEKWDELNISRN